MTSLTETDLTEFFDLLQHSHRRYVLYYLTTESETVGIERLAAETAAWARDRVKTDALLTDDVVLTALYHVHIPKLVDASLVTYDAVTRMVGLDDTDDVDWFLDDRTPIGGYTHDHSDE